MDHTTQWAEAVPLPSISAATCAEALCSAWISRFGLPHTITLDRGSQFVSSIWQNLSSFLNISHITTTAFYPQSNGLIECFHRRIKATLRARCASPDGVAHLPWFLLSYRSSPHELTNLSPAEAVYGVPLVLPGQFPISPEDDSSQFLLKLNNTLSGQLSFPPSSSTPSHDIPADLLQSHFVFAHLLSIRP
jgi:transposase InsO family protein